MSVSKACGLLACFALISIFVVFLRAEQARSVQRALAHEQEWVRLRRELWALQAEVARLKTPDQIRERVYRFRVNLLSPGEGAPMLEVPSRLASESPPGLYGGGG